MEEAQGRLERLTWQAFWRRWHPLGESQWHFCVCSPAQDPSSHQAVLGTAFLTLAVFMALYVLVYTECLVRRWLQASALLTWACLVTLGYVLVFDSWMKAACAWEQVTGGEPWCHWGIRSLWRLGLHLVCWAWALPVPTAVVP